MVAVARRHQNVYIDTSAYTTKRLPDELIRFVRTEPVIERCCSATTTR